MTDKERVLIAWPDARFAEMSVVGVWKVIAKRKDHAWRQIELSAGFGILDEEAAWQNAAESLPAQPEQETDEKDDAWKSMVESILPDPVAEVLSHEEHRRACMFNLPAYVFGSSPRVAPVEAKEECTCADDGLGPMCDYCCNKPPSVPVEEEDKPKSVIHWCSMCHTRRGCNVLPQGTFCGTCGTDCSIEVAEPKPTPSEPDPNCMCDGYGTDLCMIHRTACISCGQMLKPQPDSSSIPDLKPWLDQAVDLLNLYHSGYCPKDVAKDFLEKCRLNFGNVAEYKPLADSSSISNEPVWAVLYDDPERPYQVFTGQGAELAATAFYEKEQARWTCHLMRSAAKESK